MGIPIYHVDAFAEAPFEGNPAAVCFPPSGPSEEWMQAVAAEMNLSETAFLEPLGDAYRLRWFTPAVEADLCGHATLASAHVLWETGRLSGSAPARFETRSGELVCQRDPDGRVRMDFPADRPAAAEPAPGVIAALGVEPVATAKGRFDYVVEVSSASLVRGASPEFRALAESPVRGVILTARGDDGFDFISRFFAPGAGIDEDPVTGSAHCTLAGYWAPRLAKDVMRAFQASARGGRVDVSVSADRVELAGRAVTTLQGELLGRVRS